VVHAASPGLRSVVVSLHTATGPVNLASETYPKSGLLGSGVTEKRLHVVADAPGLNLAEGTATLRCSSTRMRGVLGDRRARPNWPNR